MLVAYFLYAFARFALGGNYGLDAIRDATPYLYAAVGIVVGVAMRSADDADKRRTIRILLIALALRTGWVFIVIVAWPQLPQSMPMVAPTQGITLFKPRSDLEAAVVAIFGAWMLLRLISGRTHRLLTFAAATVAWVTVVSTESRAAVLGAGLIAVVTGYAAIRSTSIGKSKQLAAMMAAPVVLIGVVTLLPMTTVGQSLAGTFGISTTDAGAAAQGTTKARERTWRYLLDYSNDTTPRFFVGVGFGPNYMAETAALNLLTNADGRDLERSPRAPHNYLLNTLVREGLVGFMILGGLLISIFRRVVTVASDLATDPLLFLATMMCVGLIIPATFGVILESPFGAIPFFWGAGILLSYPPSVKQRKRRSAESVEDRSSMALA